MTLGLDAVSAAWMVDAAEASKASAVSKPMFVVLMIRGSPSDDAVKTISDPRIPCLPAAFQHGSPLRDSSRIITGGHHPPKRKRAMVGDAHLIRLEQSRVVSWDSISALHFAEAAARRRGEPGARTTAAGRFTLLSFWRLHHYRVLHCAGCFSRTSIHCWVLSFPMWINAGASFCVRL